MVSVCMQRARAWARGRARQAGAVLGAPTGTTRSARAPRRRGAQHGAPPPARAAAPLPLPSERCTGRRGEPQIGFAARLAWERPQPRSFVDSSAIRQRARSFVDSSAIRRRARSFVDLCAPAPRAPQALRALRAPCWAMRAHTATLLTWAAAQDDYRDGSRWLEMARDGAPSRARCEVDEVDEVARYGSAASAPVGKREAP